MCALRYLLLHHGQHSRRELVLGASAQDACLITLLKSPWLIQPSISLVPCSNGGSGGGEMMFSSSSVRSSVPMSLNDSVEVGEAQRIEQDWEEYFADPSHWWDNRVRKTNPQSPDFYHKQTKKGLWVNDGSTPTWVKAVLKLVTQSTVPSHVDYHTTDFQEVVQSNRLPKGDFGRRDTSPVSARQSNQSVQYGGEHMRSAKTTSEATDVLKNRLRLGVATNSDMYVEVLKRCLKQEDLAAVQQVHECIVEKALRWNVFLANNLLSAYMRCGGLRDACEVFDGLVKKDVITWNVLIGGHAQHNGAKAAMEVLNRMRQDGVQPNAVTYLNILKACNCPSTLKWGEEVHALIRDGDCGSDVRVGTSLLRMYAKCGSLKEARKTFDLLASRNLISWNVMIGAYAESGFGEEAYRLLLQMKREGFTPDVITYTSVLNACASAGALEWVKEVHGHVLESGLVLDLRLGSALVHMYAKCGSLDAARRVFDQLAERNVVTWNVIIGAYAERGCGEEAYGLFERMLREGLQPDAITYMNILNACASVGALAWVKDVHNHAREGGAMADVRVGNALIHMYAKCGSMNDSRLVFERMQQRSLVTWNVMIGAYAESGCSEDAHGLFLHMVREGVTPDAITYVSILNACASAGALKWVKDIHSHARDAGFESDVRVGNALVHMYAKCGSIVDARLVFDRIEERDIVTWNVMIGGLAQHGCGLEALEVFGKMRAAGVKPDGYSFVAVLSACSHAGLVAEGRGLLVAMSQEENLVPGVLHWNCMVDLLGRAGHLEEAKLVIDAMPVAPDAATWGALLSACRSYGNVELGELAANERVKLERKDASTYVLLSNIYAAAEKWEKVSLVRKLMQERGIRKEPGRSWIAVDNKIHEFMGGGTSHPESKEIYAELRRLTEKIKAEGYLPDTRLVLHDIDEKEKELSLCSHSEKLAIAYGLICTPRSKTIRVYKNLRVCVDCHTATKLISKVTRKEIVVRDANRFHHFKEGVCSCEDYW